MHFKIVSPIENIETIAIGTSIRILHVLRKRYGEGRWRKLKGTAIVQLSDGTHHLAEVHWFEAHGIGRKKIKVKCFLD